MRALSLRQPGRLVAVELPEPRPPAPNEALVRVLSVGVCGTDLHAFLGDQPMIEYPVVPGHELAVEVLELGSPAPGLAVGDRCTVIRTSTAVGAAHASAARATAANGSPCSASTSTGA